MAIYAVYQVINLQQMPYAGQMGFIFVPRLFLTDVPQEETIESVNRALERSGYEFEYPYREVGRALPDLAWIELHVTRLKDAPEKVQAAWQQEHVQRIPWNQVNWDPAAIDTD
jgi:hypothetical protein